MLTATPSECSEVLVSPWNWPYSIAYGSRRLAGPAGSCYPLDLMWSFVGVFSKIISSKFISQPSLSVKKLFSNGASFLIISSSPFLRSITAASYRNCFVKISHHFFCLSCIQSDSLRLPELLCTVLSFETGFRKVYSPKRLCFRGRLLTNGLCTCGLGTLEVYWRQL